MSATMEEETRTVTLCSIRGWHAWAKSSKAVRVKHDRGTKCGIQYFDCPFCASTHCHRVRA